MPQFGQRPRSPRLIDCHIGRADSPPPFPSPPAGEGREGVAGSCEESCQLIGASVCDEHRRRKRFPSSQLRLWQESSNAGLRSFWQRRFYEFNGWSRKKKIEKLNYMHMNPVKRGLVAHPKDWRWSSYASYQRQPNSLIEVDFVD